MAGSNYSGSSVGSSSSSYGGSSSGSTSSSTGGSSSSSTGGSSSSSTGGSSSSSVPQANNQNSSFCELNCGRVAKYKEDILDDDGNIIRTVDLNPPRYEWRPCVKPCEINECSNCPGEIIKILMI